MPFTIIRDDITRVKADAAVNAANNGLLQGGGVCGAIFAAAGAQKLAEACGRIGHCNTGEAVITPGFDLSAKYVIHTVGPVYGENPEREAEQLYSCYKNSLELAKKYSLESVAFPLISSGIYGYPKQEALEIAIKAIKDFLSENEMQVFLVVYDKKSFSISETLFRDVKCYIDDNMTAEDKRRSKELNVFREGAEEKCFGICKEEMPACTNGGRSLDDLVFADVETFSQMLLRLIDEKGMTDVEVYKRGNIDRKLFSKIRKKDYVPKKITVLALIIGLKLSLDEAIDLLARAGYAFSAANKLDVIIMYFIEQSIYDIFEINATLFEFDQPLLGE